MGAKTSSQNVVLKPSVAEQMLERDKSLARTFTISRLATSRFDQDGDVSGAILTKPETSREGRRDNRQDRKETMMVRKALKDRNKVMDIEVSHSRGKIGLRLLNYYPSSKPTPGAPSLSCETSPTPPFTPRSTFSTSPQFTPRSFNSTNSPSPSFPRSPRSPVASDPHSSVSTPRPPSATLLSPMISFLRKDVIDPTIQELFLDAPPKKPGFETVTVKKALYKAKPKVEIAPQIEYATESRPDGLVCLLHEAIEVSQPAVDNRLHRRAGVRCIANLTQAEERSTISSDPRLSALVQLLHKEENTPRAIIRRKMKRRSGPYRRLSMLLRMNTRGDESVRSRAEVKWKWIGGKGTIQDEG